MSNATSGTKAIVMAIVDGAELGEFTDTDNVIAVLSKRRPRQRFSVVTVRAGELAEFTND